MRPEKNGAVCDENFRVWDIFSLAGYRVERCIRFVTGHPGRLGRTARQACTPFGSGKVAYDATLPVIGEQLSFS